MPETSYVVFLRVIAQLAPGSGKINLDKTYISYTDGNVFKTGVDYNMTGDNNNTVSGARYYALISFGENGVYNLTGVPR